MSKGEKAASAIMQNLGWFGRPQVRGKFNISINLLAGCAAMVCLAVGSAMAASVMQRTEAPGSEGSLESVDLGHLEAIHSFSGLVGKKVRDLNEHAVGKLEDVLLDLRRGEILAAVISPGGNGVILVPPATFRAATKEEILVNPELKLFEAAPRLSQAQAGSGLVEAYRYFHQPAPEPAAASRRLVSGAVLSGKPVFSSDSQVLGHVKDLAVDLPAGRVLYITIQPAARPGTEGKLYVAPPAAFSWDASGKLALAASRERFVAGPSFQTAFSADVIDPELVKSIYTYYLPQTGGTRTGGAHSPTQPAVAQTTPAATASAPARSDAEITKAVMMEILHEGKFTLRGDVQISTRQGRVKLSGTARNEAEKKSVVEAARRVVGATFVDDMLLVKGKTTAQAR